MTKLNVKFSVFPKSDMISIESSRPESSTKIILMPVFNILGSLVPTSSTLLLTISKAWSCEEVLISISPYFERVKVNSLFCISTSNW